MNILGADIDGDDFPEGLPNKTFTQTRVNETQNNFLKVPLGISCPGGEEENNLKITEMVYLPTSIIGGDYYKLNLIYESMRRGFI